MAMPKMTDAEAKWLISTLVHVAWIDGKVSPVEVALIERVMKAADWDEDAKKTMRRTMDGRETKPELAPPPASLTYDNKLKAFQEVTELAFADGRLERGEQDIVMRLANQLGLHLSDMQALWSRAKRHHES